ncbi:MAG: carotenoid oxygenase [Hyphomonas sp.]|uniref:8'-apo-carotenoid 13,14-cleaving dioxygenase n=1 Tax=Hyphomonas sp. TaxID=87 RepID=UPI0017982622|nr:carotenoid oxygenase family protein [Hyphomonas sp.]MBA3068585.1 carotenoid oxygenase [Hyphomonas sp.]MBU3921804.1 carotenoid oxygenase family protein [Alphaproteobacteria bacterium]MBU4061904.1 carotenoid oxygenase family protein [Alphaproteobacteria bacterium]MBU4166059.1 carotenoid oxygenase family protein [Alphaproteobacteria bacterium]
MSSPVEAAIRGVVTKGLMSVANFNRAHRKAKGPNPFLTGVHTPLGSETTLTDLKVTGAIPAALNGLYLRNGPNPFTPPNPAIHHWFVGDGMLHGVRLEGGKALWYRNRWVRSAAISKALGETPIPGPASRFESPNTNVVAIAGKIWALVEAGGLPVEVSDTLESRTRSDFDGLLAMGYTAHPHEDPLTGETHAICYNSLAPTTIWHTVIDTQGKVRRHEPIAVQDGPSIHDCMITKNHVIVMDLPVTFSMPALISGETFPYRWNPKHAARIGLLPREGKGSDIIWCDVEPCYIFHPANAYETEDGTVIMDACVHSAVFADGQMGPNAPVTTFESLEIDPAARRVTRTVIDAAPQEFPRPDERRTGQPYRYAYTVALPENGDPGFVGDPRLYKHDLGSRTRETRNFGEGKMTGEFVFVPAHAGAEEDEGWLIGFVIDTAADTTDLVILNAHDFTGPAVATITIPHRIPPGFHGNWIPLA